ncbi:MAG TPA: hypothetical protein VHF22_14070 [Planctomycetota bacterium]|nr:hypothetical protein [Planctomycetota bacterium]
MRQTMGGKTPERPSGTASVSPWRTLADASMTVSSMSRLPAVWATMSRAPRIGTPDWISVANVLAKREIATFLKSGPKTGSLRSSQSTW